MCEVYVDTARVNRSKNTPGIGFLAALQCQMTLLSCCRRGEPRADAADSDGCLSADCRTLRPLATYSDGVLAAINMIVSAP